MLVLFHVASNFSQRRIASLCRHFSSWTRWPQHTTLRKLWDAASNESQCWGDLCELWLLLSCTFVSTGHAPHATSHQPPATRLTSSVIYLCATLEPNKRKCQWDAAQMDMANTHTHTHIELGEIEEQTSDLGLAELGHKQSPTQLEFKIPTELPFSLSLSLSQYFRSSDFRFLWDLPANT